MTETTSIVGFGLPEEQSAFIARNKSFMEVLPKLLATCSQVLLRSVEATTTCQKVTFFLGRLAHEEFSEILLLSTNGYGVAAKKILRGMYERLVAGYYFGKRPEEADRFVNFSHIQRRKYANHWKSIFGSAPFSTEEMEKIERAYEEVKPKFLDTVCEKCAKKRQSSSWSPLDTLSMAKETGLHNLYIECFFEPTMQLHNTVLAIDSRLKRESATEVTFVDAPQRTEADKAIKFAHFCLVLWLEHLNSVFKLGLDEEIKQALADNNRVWSTSG